MLSRWHMSANPAHPARPGAATGAGVIDSLLQPVTRKGQFASRTEPHTRPKAGRAGRYCSYYAAGPAIRGATAGTPRSRRRSEQHPMGTEFAAIEITAANPVWYLALAFR
jgi:hypothetical protein